MKLTPKEKIIILLNIWIDVEKESTFINHMKSKQSTTYGTVGRNSFSTWQKNHWTGDFFYVFNGTLEDRNNRLHIEISPQWNHFGTLIAFSILALISYGLISGVIIQRNMKFDSEFIFHVGLSIVVLSICIGVFRMIYRFEMKKQHTELTEFLKSDLQVCTKGNALTYFDTKCYIAVNISNLEALVRALNDLNKFFSRSLNTKDIVLFRSLVIKDQFYVSFTNRPTLEYFTLFVNLLINPEEKRLKGSVRGYWELTTDNVTKDFAGSPGERIMVFIPEAMKTYHEVYLALEGYDKSNYEVELGHENLSGRIISTLETFHEQHPEIQDLGFVDFINPITYHKKPIVNY